MNELPFRSLDTVETQRVTQRFFANPKDPQAQQDFAEANLGLIIEAINLKFKSLPGQIKEDLFQEGYLGLINAVDHWDPDRGVQFSTYAMISIFRFMWRYLKNHSTTIRLPVYIWDSKTALDEAEAFLTSSTGETASNEAIAQMLGIPESKVAELRNAYAIASPLSLDTPVDGESGDFRTLADCLFGNFDAPSIDTLLIMGEITRFDLEKALNQLPEKSIRCLLMLAQDGNFSSAAEAKGITREGMRQRVFTSIRNLRRLLGIDPKLPIVFPGTSRPERVGEKHKPRKKTEV